MLHEIILVPQVKVIACYIRKFSVGISCNKDLNYQAKFMNKLVSSPNKKRRNFICETPPSSGNKLNFGKEFRSSKENSRRINVLNKLFIKSISDILATGGLQHHNVLEKGLQISRVAMASNFQQLNVFWFSSNNENTEALNALLPDLGFSLRHELSQLRVMGNMPRIVFVSDKQHENALKVEYLLSIADFGDDYKPSDTSSEFKTSAEPSEIKLSTDTEADCEVGEVETMPVMRQDTLNLNHENIMNKIKKSLHKSRAVHRFNPNLAIDCQGTPAGSEMSMIESMSNKERKVALAKFILDRRTRLKRENREFTKYGDKNVKLDTNEEDDTYGNEYDFEEDFFDEEDFEDEKYNQK